MTKISEQNAHINKKSGVFRVGAVVVSLLASFHVNGIEVKARFLNQPEAINLTFKSPIESCEDDFRQGLTNFKAKEFKQAINLFQNTRSCLEGKRSADTNVRLDLVRAKIHSSLLRVKAYDELSSQKKAEVNEDAIDPKQIILDFVNDYVAYMKKIVEIRVPRKNDEVYVSDIPLFTELFASLYYGNNFDDLKLFTLIETVLQMMIEKSFETDIAETPYYLSMLHNGLGISRFAAATSRKNENIANKEADFLKQAAYFALALIKLEPDESSHRNEMSERLARLGKSFQKAHDLAQAASHYQSAANFLAKDAHQENATVRTKRKYAKLKILAARMQKKAGQVSRAGDLYQEAMDVLYKVTRDNPEEGSLRVELAELYIESSDLSNMEEQVLREAIVTLTQAENVPLSGKKKKLFETALARLQETVTKKYAEGSKAANQSIYENLTSTDLGVYHPDMDVVRLFVSQKVAKGDLRFAAEDFGNAALNYHAAKMALKELSHIPMSSELAELYALISHKEGLTYWKIEDLKGARHLLQKALGIYQVGLVNEKPAAPDLVEKRFEGLKLASHAYIKERYIDVQNDLAKLAKIEEKKLQQVQ